MKKLIVDCSKPLGQKESIVDMTSEEVAEAESQHQAHETARPMVEWEALMAEEERWISNALEDVIDAMDVVTRANIAAETLDKYTNKKVIREQKPQTT